MLSCYVSILGQGRVLLMKQKSETAQAPRAKLAELAVFALFAALMFASRFALQGIHGLHPLTLIMAAFTMVWRRRALVLIYLYVAIELITGGFAWAWPYLYVFLPLWAAVLFWAWLFERRPGLPLPVKVAALMLTCGMHGLGFGLLYAPAQLLMMNVKSWEGILAWWLAGLTFDAVHGAFQFALGSLALPLAALLGRLRRGLAKV